MFACGFKRELAILLDRSTFRHYNTVTPFGCVWKLVVLPSSIWHFIFEAASAKNKINCFSDQQKQPSTFLIQAENID